MLEIIYKINKFYDIIKLKVYFKYQNILTLKFFG